MKVNSQSNVSVSICTDISMLDDVSSIFQVLSGKIEMMIINHVCSCVANLVKSPI